MVTIPALLANSVLTLCTSQLIKAEPSLSGAVLLFLGQDKYMKISMPIRSETKAS